MANDIKTGTQINAGAIGTKMLIMQNYVHGAAYQPYVEAARNVDQVVRRTPTPRGDEMIKFDLANLPFQQFNEGGSVVKEIAPVKRRIWNTAAPMDPRNEMLAYFTTLGIGGGDDRFDLDNLSGSFGKGMRASILPHSDLMIITTQPKGKSHAIAIMDTAEGYALMRFNQVDSDGEPINFTELVELDDAFYLDNGRWSLEMSTETLVHPEVKHKGGTTFILLGRSLLNSYTEGDHSKGETGGGLANRITDRMNMPIPMEVEYVIPADEGPRADGRVRGVKIVVDGTVMAVDRRRIKPFDAWTSRATASGTVTLDDYGTGMSWYLLPEGGTKSPGARWLPFQGSGFLVAEFGCEMMPLYPRNSYWTPKNILRKWGIIEPSVALRVGLIIHPPVLKKPGAWGVMQNESRSMLVGPNGSPLEMENWINAWFDQMPQEIKDAINKAKPKADADLDEEAVKRIQAEIKARGDAFKRNTIKIIEPYNDDEDGDHEASVETAKTGHNPTNKSRHGDGHEGDDARPLAKPGGKRKAATHEVPQAMPEVRWYPYTDDEGTEHGWDPDLGEDIFCNVVFNPAAGEGAILIELNKGHTIYQNQVAYYTSTGRDGWLATLGRGKTSFDILAKQEAAPDAIRQAYGSDIIMKVMWIHGDNVHRKGTDQDFLNRVNPVAMTDALSGYLNVDHAIKTRISDVASGRKTVIAAA